MCLLQYPIPCTIYTLYVRMYIRTFIFISKIIRHPRRAYTFENVCVIFNNDLKLVVNNVERIQEGFLGPFFQCKFKLQIKLISVSVFEFI